jgi:nicotinate-nucleotide pyrophosphorylase (carboxylating)
VTALASDTTFIACTRKTWASATLEKHAAGVGGALSHRLNLADFPMLKDNHLTALRLSGSTDPIKEGIAHIIETGYRGPIEVETENPTDALHAAEIFRSYKQLDIIPIIMLDNSNPSEIAPLIEQIKDAALIEVSGNVTLENLSLYANSGVDVISTSAIIREAKPLDLSLSFRNA